MNRLMKGLKNPYKVLLRLILMVPGLSERIDDKTYLSIKYRAHMGKKINWNNPTTFNEKLQWLKLYDRRPEYSVMVDKYEVKDYVANIIGEEHIIQTLGVWDKFDDINFDSLPNQFVLKCTHDSGGLVICQDKSKFDVEKAKEIINKCLKNSFYYRSREWPYQSVKPRIIAEQYMEDDVSRELRDYKFFCFDGKVKCFKIDFNRFVCHQANYYGEDMNLLPFEEIAFPRNPMAEIAIPDTVPAMMILAERLSENIPFVRIDLYDVNGQIYFGEMTFYPAGGFGVINPKDWDRILGDWIQLPDLQGSLRK